MNGHLIVIYSVCVFFAQKSTKCVVSERVIVVECQVSKFTVIIWPDQVGFWWMDFIVLTHWKNSQSIDRHVALIGNLIPSLSQSVFLSYSFILSSNKSQFYRFDTSGDLTYDLLVYATGGEQANHYTTEAVKEKSNNTDHLQQVEDYDYQEFVLFIEYDFLKQFPVWS
jgi:hypothetical protein